MLHLLYTKSMRFSLESALYSVCMMMFFVSLAMILSRVQSILNNAELLDSQVGKVIGDLELIATERSEAKESHWETFKADIAEIEKARLYLDFADKNWVIDNIRAVLRMMKKLQVSDLRKHEFNQIARNLQTMIKLIASPQHWVTGAPRWYSFFFDQDTKKILDNFYLMKNTLMGLNNSSLEQVSAVLEKCKQILPNLKLHRFTDYHYAALLYAAEDVTPSLMKKLNALSDEQGGSLSDKELISEMTSQLGATLQDIQHRLGGTVHTVKRLLREFNEDVEIARKNKQPRHLTSIELGLKKFVGYLHASGAEQIIEALQEAETKLKTVLEDPGLTLDFLVRQALEGSLPQLEKAEKTVNHLLALKRPRSIPEFGHASKNLIGINNTN